MADHSAHFNQTSLKCSEIITRQYSDNFTMTVQSLEERFRLPLYALYGFVRLADELVDTFHDKDKQLLLDKLKKDTSEAIDTGISLNPVLQAFQLIVNKYKIDLKLISTFLHSMEMDLDIKTFDDAKLKEYVKGSAEAFALMCLQVLCEDDRAAYEKALEPAGKLAVAFQKVNFLRDLSSDYHERGRVYFPGLDFKSFNTAAKKLIEDDIERDFEDSVQRIEQFPTEAKRLSKVSYLYYRKLFGRIKASTPETILRERVRISAFDKLYIRIMNRPNYYFYTGLFLLATFSVLRFCFVPVFHYVL